eukprot:Gb_05085 [translate_table: standard]
MFNCMRREEGPVSLHPSDFSNNRSQKRITWKLKTAERSDVRGTRVQTGRSSRNLSRGAWGEGWSCAGGRRWEKNSRQGPTEAAAVLPHRSSVSFRQLSSPSSAVSQSKLSARLGIEAEGFQWLMRYCYCLLSLHPGLFIFATLDALMINYAEAVRPRSSSQRGLNHQGRGSFLGEQAILNLTSLYPSGHWLLNHFEPDWDPCYVLPGCNKSGVTEALAD